MSRLQRTQPCSTRCALEPPFRLTLSHFCSPFRSFLLVLRSFMHTFPSLFPHFCSALPGDRGSEATISRLRYELFARFPHVLHVFSACGSLRVFRVFSTCYLRVVLCVWFSACLWSRVFRVWFLCVFRVWLLRVFRVFSHVSSPFARSVLLSLMFADLFAQRTRAESRRRTSSTSSQRSRTRSARWRRR